MKRGQHWIESPMDEEDIETYGEDSRRFELFDYDQDDPQIIDTRFVRPGETPPGEEKRR